MKCDKCGYSDNGSGDWAHVCGTVNIKSGADIHAGDGAYSIGTKEKYDEFVKGRNQSLGKMRIRELAEQATTYIEPTSNSGEGWIFDKEKFAELIINECCNRLGEETIRHDGYGYNQHELYNRLRKHFGVEE
jgi:hypothetical protein